MADSDESVELLFFDTFSHEINEVSQFKLINISVIYRNVVKILKFVENFLCSSFLSDSIILIHNLTLFSWFVYKC